MTTNKQTKNKQGASVCTVTGGTTSALPPGLGRCLGRPRSWGCRCVPCRLVPNNDGKRVGALSDAGGRCLGLLAEKGAPLQSAVPETEGLRVRMSVSGLSCKAFFSQHEYRNETGGKTPSASRPRGRSPWRRRVLKSQLSRPARG